MTHHFFSDIGGWAPQMCYVQYMESAKTSVSLQLVHLLLCSLTVLKNARRLDKYGFWRPIRKSHMLSVAWVLKEMSTLC